MLSLGFRSRVAVLALDASSIMLFAVQREMIDFFERHLSDQSRNPSQRQSVYLGDVVCPILFNRCRVAEDGPLIVANDVPKEKKISVSFLGMWRNKVAWSYPSTPFWPAIRCSASSTAD